jgi:hypothetical protein
MIPSCIYCSEVQYRKESIRERAATQWILTHYYTSHVYIILNLPYDDFTFNLFEFLIAFYQTLKFEVSRFNGDLPSSADKSNIGN